MLLLQIFVILLYGVVFIFLLIYLIFQIWIDITNIFLKRKYSLPYVPTSRKRLKAIMNLAEIKPGDKVIDLGSGDGRLVIAAAKQGAEAEGFELNLSLVWFSQIKIFLFSFKDKTLKTQVKIFHKNLLDADFNKYNVFLLYTMPWTMKEIKNRLNDLKYDKIKLISNTFEFEGWQPTRIDQQNKIYLYEIKKNKD